MPSPSIRLQMTFGRESRTARLGLYRVVETHHAAHTRLPRHDHEAPSLNIVLEGGFDERIGSESVRSSAGSLVAKPSGSHHANQYGTVGTVSILVFPALGDLHRLGDMARAFGEVRSREGPRILELGRRLRALLRGDDDQELTAALLLEEILADMAGRAPLVGHFDRQPPWANRIREQLVQRARERISVGALARAEGVQLTAVAKAFRRFYDTTPSEVLRSARVEHAKRMLADERRALSDIALSCGFADQAHLTRAFKRETALTPGQFRRLLAK